MGKKADVRVTESNLYRNGRRCAIGDKFEVTLSNKGEIPMLYRGKVELVEQSSMQVATPNAPDNDTGNTSEEADEQRKEWLLDEIEKLTGKRPGGNSKLETLEAKYEEAKLAED